MVACKLVVTRHARASWVSSMFGSSCWQACRYCLLAHCLAARADNFNVVCVPPPQTVAVPCHVVVVVVELKLALFWSTNISVKNLDCLVLLGRLNTIGSWYRIWTKSGDSGDLDKLFLYAKYCYIISILMFASSAEHTIGICYRMLHLNNGDGDNDNEIA